MTEPQPLLTPTRPVSAACDCNMEGTQRPSCNPETGECICRTGVTGIFCDECAPGYDPNFPACKECHPCASLLAKDVTDVERASQVLKTIIPDLDHLQQGDNHHLKLMKELLAKLNGLSNLTALSPPMVEEMEEMYNMMRLVLKIVPG